MNIQFGVWKILNPNSSGQGKVEGVKHQLSQHFEGMHWHYSHSVLVGSGNTKVIAHCYKYPGTEFSISVFSKKYGLEVGVMESKKSPSGMTQFYNVNDFRGIYKHLFLRERQAKQLKN